MRNRGQHGGARAKIGVEDTIGRVQMYEKMRIWWAVQARPDWDEEKYGNRTDALLHLVDLLVQHDVKLRGYRMSHQDKVSASYARINAWFRRAAKKMGLLRTVFEDIAPATHSHVYELGARAIDYELGFERTQSEAHREQANKLEEIHAEATEKLHEPEETFIARINALHAYALFPEMHELDREDEEVAQLIARLEFCIPWLLDFGRNVLEKEQID